MEYFRRCGWIAAGKPLDQRPHQVIGKLHMFEAKTKKLEKIVDRVQYILVGVFFLPKRYDSTPHPQDAGANAGFTSVQMALKYPHATIISLEPQPENFQVQGTPDV